VTPIRLLHALHAHWQRAFPALLLAVVLGQTSLLVHAMEHALEDGNPVCEICTVSQSTADTSAVPAMARAVASPDPIPFLGIVPPSLKLRVAAARDPPFPSLS
jgi:hypothetical protein